MRVEIKTTILPEGDKEVTGWDLIPETQEEENQVCVIRDTIFFGVDDRHIEYAGRTGDSDNMEWPIDRLKWRRKKHLKTPEEAMEVWKPRNKKE